VMRSPSWPLTEGSRVGDRSLGSENNNGGGGNRGREVGIPSVTESINQVHHPIPLLLFYTKSWKRGCTRCHDCSRRGVASGMRKRTKDNGCVDIKSTEGRVRPTEEPLCIAPGRHECIVVHATVAQVIQITWLLPVKQPGSR
jgi:hypothetical protein